MSPERDMMRDHLKVDLQWSKDGRLWFIVTWDGGYRAYELTGGGIGATGGTESITWER